MDIFDLILAAEGVDVAYEGFEPSEIYPRAKEVVHPDVAPVVQEYFDLPAEERKKTILLYYIIGQAGTPALKAEPQAYDYVKRSQVEGQICHNCKSFYWRTARDRGVCSQINPPDEGQPEYSEEGINRQGWCSLWKP